MKKIILILLAAMVAQSTPAREKSSLPEKQTKKRKTRVRPDSCPPAYITTSTGFNNNTGVFGFSVDIPVSEDWSVEGGVGAGTWNYKFYAGAKRYLKPCHRGFAFGAALSYCTGSRSDQHDLETVNKTTESVIYNKAPRVLVSLMAYKYWSIGKKYNRIYIESGFSAPIGNSDKITQVSGTPISSDTRKDLNSGLQFGPILAAGVSFGINGNQREYKSGSKKTAKKGSRQDEEILIPKNHLYADAGISLAELYPGLSVTYNYRLLNWIGIGIGAQGYPWYPTITNNQEFIPGIFGDFRFTIRPRKKGQLFTFLDIGADFYKHTDYASREGTVIYTVPKNNGTFVGLGIGYFRRITKHGGGAYVSVKVIDNEYRANAYDFATNTHYTTSWGRSTLAVSLGFKF